MMRCNESLNFTAKVAKLCEKVAEQGLLCVPLRIPLAPFALKFISETNKTQNTFYSPYDGSIRSSLRSNPGHAS
jgi:hypothetical protein